ncbi:MAG TPA: VWA domain-containing protein [Vicinamibacterales bacterium]
MTRSSVGAGVLFLLLLSSAGGIRGAQDQPEPPRFRVGVDVVRIDAVVTDRDGNIVSDLTADDFELRQDGEVQRLDFVQFVSIEPPAPAPRPAPLQSTPRSAALSLTAPPVVSSGIARERVQRTIVLVVDDLGIAWENMEATRKALRRFIDEEMQDGDLVAITRTGAEWGALQQLTTDRRVLHAAVDQVRWTALSRREVTAFTPVNDWLPLPGIAGPLPEAAPVEGPEGHFSPPGTLFGSAGRARAGERLESKRDPLQMGMADDLRQSMSSSATLNALEFTIEGIRDVPGRKAVVLISEGFHFLEEDALRPALRVADRLRQLTDAALRTGTVIYTLDPRGLVTAGLSAMDNINVGSSASAVRHSRERMGELLATQDAMAFLAEETGGLAVLNTNDLPAGLRRISNDLRGYYILGYTPPPGTFAEPGKTPRFRKVTVRAKRPGLKVRTRKGFIGVIDPPSDPSTLSPEEQLRLAAVSPFRESDIPLRVTAVHKYAPGDGLFVRALLHIDQRALTFEKGPDGRPQAVAEAIGLVFDESGALANGSTAQFTITLGEDRDEPVEAGIVHSLTVPLKRAGGYQLRVAVRDVRSGAIGSAGQFFEIPPADQGQLALSSLLVGPEIGGPTGSPDVADGEAVADATNPIQRVFTPGTRLAYTCEIYNAPGPVETQIAVWRNGRRIFTAPPSTLSVPKDSRVVTAAGGIRLEQGIAPGDYVLQISAVSTKGKKPVAASQWTDFVVR